MLVPNRMRTSRPRPSLVMATALLGIAFLAAPAVASRQPPSGRSARRASWPMFHLSLDRTGYNRHETILSPDTVGGLVLKWSAPLGEACSGSPLVAGGNVFVGDSGGTLHAIDVSTGTERWNRVLGNQGTGTPSIAGGMLYVTTLINGGLWALDPRTGATVWTREDMGSQWGSPAITNGRLYIGSFGGAWALDPATGATLWQSDKVGLADAPPSVVDGVVYQPTDDFLAKLYALDARTGAVEWSALTGAGIYSSAAVANGVVYVGDDVVHAYRASDGELLWSYSTSGMYSRAPAVVDGMLYTCSFDGSLYAFGLP